MPSSLSSRARASLSSSAECLAGVDAFTHHEPRARVSSVKSVVLSLASYGIMLWILKGSVEEMLYSAPTVSTTELQPLPAATEYTLPRIGVGLFGSLGKPPYRNNHSWFRVRFQVEERRVLSADPGAEGLAGEYDAGHQYRTRSYDPKSNTLKQSWHINTTFCEIPLGKNGRLVLAHCPASDINLAGEYVKDHFTFAMAIIEPCYAYEHELVAVGQSCAPRDAVESLFCISEEKCLGIYGTASLYVHDAPTSSLSQWISPMYLNLEPRAWTGIETIFKPVTGRTRTRLGYDSDDSHWARFSSWYTRRAPAIGHKGDEIAKFYLKLASDREMQVTRFYGVIEFSNRIGSSWTNLCLTLGALALMYNRIKARRGGSAIGGAAHGSNTAFSKLWGMPASKQVLPSKGRVDVHRVDACAEHVIDIFGAGASGIPAGAWTCPNCTLRFDSPRTTLAKELKTGHYICPVCRLDQICRNYKSTGKCESKDCVFEHVRVVPAPEAAIVEGKSAGASQATAPSLRDTVDVCFSFDTTGSMSKVLDDVRTHIFSSVDRLFKAGPGVRIALIAHGDYVDEANAYACKLLDFSRDTAAIKSFLDGCHQTGGGSVDDGEAYELAIHHARTSLDWRAAHKSLVLIGDDRPHPPEYAQNTGNIDWRYETRALRQEFGVSVHAVQCFGRAEAGAFWTELAALGGGEHLSLTAAEFQKGNAHRLFTAICMASVGTRELQRFEKEMHRQAEGGLTDENKKWFQRLMRLSLTRVGPAAGTAAVVAAAMVRDAVRG
jgi:hypothetical protein